MRLHVGVCELLSGNGASRFAPTRQRNPPLVPVRPKNKEFQVRENSFKLHLA